MIFVCRTPCPELTRLHGTTRPAQKATLVEGHDNAIKRVLLIHDPRRLIQQASSTGS
jgi:hypothetical protein